MRTVILIWQMSSVRWRPGGPVRWPLPVGTICCSTVRRVSARLVAERVPGLLLLPELGVSDALEVQRCILSPVSISPTN